MNSDPRLENAVDSDANHNADSTTVESTIIDDSVIEDDDFSFLFNSAVSLPLSAVTSRAELIKLRQEDPTLKPLFDLVDNPPESEFRNDKAHYALSNGVLVRYWRDRNVHHTVDCVSKQIVVTFRLRTSLLQLGHDIPAAGHLGHKRLELEYCSIIIGHCNEVHLNYVKCIIVYTHITLALYRLD